MIKIVTSKKISGTSKLPIPPSLTVYPDICQSGAVWRGSQHKILILKIPTTKHSCYGCNSPVWPEQATACSCPAAGAEWGLITASLLSLLAQRRNICCVSFPGIKLLLFSFSCKRGITEPELHKLPNSACHLLTQFGPIPKKIYLIKDFY